MTADKKALEYCIDRIKESGEPGSEVVIGALALWIAAHGDYDLPQIEPTPEIIETDETIEDAPEVSQKSAVKLPAGIVLLADKNEPTASEILAKIPDVDSTAEFYGSLQEKLAPIAMAIHMKTPGKSESKDKNFFGMMKKNGEHTWGYEQALGERHLFYKFAIDYTPGKSSNEAKSLTMDFGLGEEASDYRLQILLGGGGVSDIRFGDRKDSGEYNCITYLRDFMAELSPELTWQPRISADWDKDLLGGDTNHYPGSWPNQNYPRNFALHTFSLDSSQISFNSQGYWRDELRGATITRTYSPQTDEFNTFRTYKGGNMYGESMSKQRILQLLDVVLGLIPTRALESDL